MIKITQAVFPVDKAFEFEAELERRGEKQLLKMVQGILPRHVSCTYVRQPQALGLGHAILCAMPVVGEAPFAVLLADDLIDGSPPALKQMCSAFGRRGRSVIAVQNVERRGTRRCGIVKMGYLQANLQFALKHPEIGAAFRKCLRGPGRRTSK